MKIISDDHDSNESYDPNSLLPTTTDIISVMKKVFGLEIDDNNNLELDLFSMVNETF